MSTRSRDGEPWALCEVTWRRGYVSGAFVAVRQGDAPREIGKSPRFRWRNGAPAPPELPEIVSCLAALENDLATEGWERIDHERSDWCALRFRRRVAPLLDRIDHYAVEADEHSIAWLSQATQTDATFAAVASAPSVGGSDEPRPTHFTLVPVESRSGGEGARVEPIRRATQRREAKHLEAERLASERREAKHLEAERLEAERLEAERLEAERLEAERLEAERLEAERLEAERLEAERLEAERLVVERVAGLPLHDRLSAYSAKSPSQVEIRTFFEPKKDPRRDDRSNRRRRYRI